MNAHGILIVGGYGVVGARIAAELAPDYPDRVIVAGRNLHRAKATATAIGHGVRGRELDVTMSSSIAAALSDVAVVMSCIDQPGRGLMHAAIERGLRYTDITPHLTELGRGVAYEKIDAAARASGARLVLGTGIVPGIANVMVRAIADALGGAEEIETSLLLSARDVAGPASFDYFLQELSMPFEIHVNGADRPAYAFSDQRLVEFPPPIGRRPAYLFPFSDQVLYPRTMGARTALTRLAIEPTWLAKLLAVVVRTGAARLISREAVRYAIAQRRRKGVPREDTLFALRVDVIHHGQSSHATLLGHAQADAAAAGAAGLLRALLDGEVAKPGAWMPEQVIDPGPFFARLAARGLRVKLALVPERVNDFESVPGDRQGVGGASPLR
jgi:saccharopine dehydrogenase-like NADP-dependent oxidoreductase